jgi:hypothetical protein
MHFTFDPKKDRTLEAAAIKAKIEKMTPEEVAASTLSKDVFFAISPLSEMTKPGAAESTYQRWLMTKRIKEDVTIEESPDGREEDRRDVRIPAKFFFAEWRRSNINKRKIAEMAAQGFDTRPLAARAN